MRRSHDIEARPGKGRAHAVCALALSAALACTLVPACPARQAEAETVSSATGLVKEDGHWRYRGPSGKLATSAWKTVDGGRYYFDADGNALVGAAKVKGKRYVFDARGRLFRPVRAKFVKVAGKIYYVNAKGRPGARGWLLKKERFYYVRATGQVVTNGTVDGIRLTKTGASKNDRASKLKLATVRRIAKITKPSWSRKKKLEKCFWWLFKLPFSNATTPRYIGQRGWVQRRALEVFRSGRRECWGHACAFAMMAYELGYKPKVRGKRFVHGYVICNGKRWDSVLYKPRISPTVTWKVVSWRDVSPRLWGRYAREAKKAKPAASTGYTGFKTVRGNLRYYEKGKMLKRKWLTVGKKTYYFKANGAAATGSVRAARKGFKKGYWVFGAKHTLLTGKSTRDVKVAGATYRVAKTGAAVPGWADGGTRLHLPTGELATGTRLVSGKLMAFSAAGAYDADLSAKLQAAAVTNGDPTGLLALLGKAKSVKTTPNSCYGYLGMKGSDVAHRYAHVTVNVFAAEDGNEYLESVV